MKDYLGKMLEIDDEVIHIAMSGGITRAKIVGFTPKMVKLSMKYTDTYSTYHNTVNPYKIIKVSHEE